MSRLKLILLSILLCTASGAHAQGVVTALAVKSALEGVISEFRKAAMEATQDLQSLGNSLQANAQNVIQDIDRTLGSKINLTFDRLDATELRLVEDAQALTKQMQTATSQLLAKAGDEARATIVQADIAAYSASYSLPCRDAKPRLVASFPARFVAKRTTPVMSLKGNFLRQGTLRATVNGKTAKIVQRLDSEVSVAIPDEIINGIGDDEIILSTAIEGFEEIERSLWAWGLLGCHESRKTTNQAPIGFSVLEPPFSYSVEGTVKLTYNAFREVPEASQHFSNTGSDQCDDSYRVDQQWCVQGPGTLLRAIVSNVGPNCNSGFEGTVPSGDRCVLARGKVGGCGANRGPFNTWLGCKGRGWLNYDIQLIRSEPYQTESPVQVVNQVGKPGTKSFNIVLPSSANLNNPVPWYALTVKVNQGKKTIHTFAISQANPNTGPVSSRANGGLLAVDVNSP